MRDPKCGLRHIARVLDAIVERNLRMLMSGPAGKVYGDAIRLQMERLEEARERWVRDRDGGLPADPVSAMIILYEHLYNCEECETD